MEPTIGTPLDPAAVHATCAYTEGPTGTGCADPATTHLIAETVSGDASTGVYAAGAYVVALATCDAHLPVAHAAAQKILAEHAFVDTCAQPGSRWRTTATGANECYVENEPTA